MTHTIRLADHWTPTPVASGTRFARRFGAPRLTTETVWLAGTASGPGALSINGEPVGTIDGEFAIEITSLLKPRNDVAIELHDEGASIADVRLEIR